MCLQQNSSKKFKINRDYFNIHTETVTASASFAICTKSVQTSDFSSAIEKAINLPK